ncbi:hypothetical protein PENTCL1PPCAC_9604, partial [Pristionchus entomophagus]
RMADNSNFALRWEIDNARAALAAGTIRSRVFNEGGFKWYACISHNINDPKYDDFMLICLNQHGVTWKFEADVGLVFLNSTYGEFTKKEQMKLSSTKNAHDFRPDHFHFLADPKNGYNKNDKLVIEFRINITSLEKSGEVTTKDEPVFEMSKFSSPNEIGNVILVIEGKKVKVSKEYLAVQSPFLATKFFGDSAEKGKEEMEIKDVDYYYDFLFLLGVIFLEK